MDLEELEAQHKRERKDLQAKAQKMKHAVPKGDKKRLKEAKEEIGKLEDELENKHQLELQEHELHEAAAGMTIQSNPASEEPHLDGDDIQLKKKSKAAKRREKKEREEKERQARIEEGAKESLTGARHIEQRLISEKLKQRNLTLYDIPSDGDCLYKAVAHQLAVSSKNSLLITVSELRTRVADEMRQNKDEYLPFLTSSNGEMLDECGFNEYCDQLQQTHEWGGHVEVKAMTAVLSRSLLIIQADLPDILIKQDCSEESLAAPLVLIYHKKLFELGEHYNSVIPNE